MSLILRTLLALDLVFTALVYWQGEFNEYVTIDGRRYVDSQPSRSLRLAYSVGLGTAATLIVGPILFALRRVSSRWWLTGFLSLAIGATVLEFLFGDLNMYVIGHGPGGRDWLKNGSPWGMQRFIESAILGTIEALLSLPVLWLLSGTQTVPKNGHPSTENVPSTDRNA